MSKPYEMTGHTTASGFEIIRLTEGRFEGVEFNYAKVAFDDTDKDNVKLVFEYFIQSDHTFHSKSEIEAFENYLSGLLLDILNEQILENKTVYSGGI